VKRGLKERHLGELDFFPSPSPSLLSPKVGAHRSIFFKPAMIALGGTIGTGELDFLPSPSFLAFAGRRNSPLDFFRALRR